VLGDGQDIDPEVDANVKEVYKDWYTQPESAFWTKYAQIISSTSMPLDGQVRLFAETAVATNDRHSQVGVQPKVETTAATGYRHA
jgi:stress response protein YsnF